MGYQVLIEILLKEGKRKSQEIVEKGRLESEAILLKAKEKTDQFEQERRREVQKELLFTRTKILNEALLDGQRVLLEAKHEILNILFERALERIQTWLKETAGTEQSRLFWKSRVEETLQTSQSPCLKAFLPEDGSKDLESVFKEKGIPYEKVKDADLWCGFKVVLEEGRVEVTNSYPARFEKIGLELMTDLHSLLFKKNG